MSGWYLDMQRVKVKSRMRVEECQGNISALGSPGLGALMSCPQMTPGSLRSVMAWCEGPVSGQHKGHPQTCQGSR